MHSQSPACCQTDRVCSRQRSYTFQSTKVWILNTNCGRSAFMEICFLFSLLIKHIETFKAIPLTENCCIFIALFIGTLQASYSKVLPFPIVQNGSQSVNMPTIAGNSSFHVQIYINLQSITLENSGVNKAFSFSLGAGYHLKPQT